jgi:hypothetical protein
VRGNDKREQVLGLLDNFFFYGDCNFFDHLRSKTRSGLPEDNRGNLNIDTEIIDLAGKEMWLGEKDSNPHSQNQNPPKPTCDTE